MKFTLKDYQEDAVAEVLKRLTKARKDWHDGSYKNAFSLTATTGAGKTVMAAAAIEALFYGSDQFDFVGDRGAVVIWFSDDPSLNEQSRWRLHQASDKLTVSDLVTVDNSFGRERFEPGKVYFLNTQKLSKKSLLVRGHDPADAAIERDDRQMPIMPDMRAHTIWDTIRNTIEDPDLTLYLVLDEAHRGMRDGGTAASGKPTIVRQLINGTGSVPGIPVVWGISATVQRFNDAMAGMEGRGTLPNVVVDPKKVQDSGLIKDTINLAVPTEVGDFNTALLKLGTEKLRDISKAWADYAAQQDGLEPVLPLMVLQVPNSPDPKEIAEWLDVVFAAWPDLPADSIANVFGEHRTEKFGKYSAPYIEPERVQETTDVRILIAKDAISTGWDCPRAEVMVSFRVANDRTHITQLLGRMVRTPLARRIPGNGRLNAVDCILPRFDKASVEAVVNTLMTGGDAGDQPLRRVFINPVDVFPNPDIPEDVWEKLVSLPSQTPPKKQARPVNRLTLLAHELAVDGLLPAAGAKAHAKMHEVLDRMQARYAVEIGQARNAVLTIEGTVLTTNLGTKEKTFNDFLADADYAVIEDAFKRAARLITPDVAKTYAEHLAIQVDGDEYDDEALIDAHTTVAALGLLPQIKLDLDAAAEALARQWLTDHHEAMRNLSDERQEAYRLIRESSLDPLDVNLARPRSWVQPTSVKEPGCPEITLPTYDRHLLCDASGKFPDMLNEWEQIVLTTEMKHRDRLGWYRNPDRASQESLGIVYDDAGEVKMLRPDFLFFSRQGDGSIAVDIVDPHGHHLADSLPKLKGLAQFARIHGSRFRRIEAVTKVDDIFRVLDLTREDVRNAIEAASSAKALYVGAFGSAYLAQP